MASAVWQRCWCYRFGRCLSDCPTADLPRPHPLIDDYWRAAYAAALAAPPVEGSDTRRVPGG